LGYPLAVMVIHLPPAPPTGHRVADEDGPPDEAGQEDQRHDEQQHDPHGGHLPVDDHDDTRSTSRQNAHTSELLGAPQREHAPTDSRSLSATSSSSGSMRSRNCR